MALTMMNIFSRLSRTCRAYYYEGRARSAFGRGNVADAAREAETLLREAPERSDAQFLLAQIYVAGARHREALALLRQVVISWPDDAPSWYAIGVCCDYLEEHHAAAAAYNRTLQIAPHWVVALKHLGRCAWKTGNREMARKALQQYCAEMGDDEEAEEAHDLLGYLEYEDGRMRQSFGHYAQALRLDPMNPKLDRNARVLYRRSALS